ncbi:MAG: FAD-binding protein [Anaerolineae bacterium]|nr:FAD-binding protein [Anaerolineae bacterium]
MSSTNVKSNRRRFMRGSALAGAGLLAAASGAQAQDASEEMTFDQETDILVLGLGLAGLVAAARATELGVRVMAVEKLPNGYWAPGGSFVLSGQLVLQPPKPYPQTVEAVGIDTVVRSMQWLAGLGIELGGSIQIEGVNQIGEEIEGIPGGTVFPMKPVADTSFLWYYLKPGGEFDATQYGGGTAPRVLEQHIIDNGGTVVYETAARRLLTNKDGAVIGAQVVGPDGPYTIGAKAVVLCTGGFALNEEMVSKYVCSPSRSLVNATQATPGSTGDGLKMALEVGAAASGFGYIYGWPAAIIAERTPMHDLSGFLSLDTLSKGIIVLDNGERFADESLGRNVYGNLMVKEHMTNTAWYILDATVYEDTQKVMDKLAMFQEEFGETLVYQADTLEELATAAGIGGYLVTQVEEYNQAVDDEAVGRMRVPRTTPYTKLETPPFYAVPFVMGSNKSFGGPNVDTSARVLNELDEPIPGLYAAGEVVYNAKVKGVPFWPNDLDHIAAGAGSGNQEQCLIFGILSVETAVADAGLGE